MGEQTMNIEEYADAINVNIEVLRVRNRVPRWMASFEYTYEIDGIFERGAYGDGDTPEEAINNYVAEIRGKRLRIGSRAERREFTVPMELEGVRRV
jgi:hypothetical protein